MLRGSIRFSPSPSATDVSFLLSNSELATSTRTDFDRFWNVWLSAPRLQTLHLDFAIGACEGPAAYEGINQFLAHYAYYVLPNDYNKLALVFHLNNWTEFDEMKRVVKEVLEKPVELYNSEKQCGMRFVSDDIFIGRIGYRGQ